MVNSSDRQHFLDEAFGEESLITVAVTLGPLAICSLCCLPWYIKASQKNVVADDESPFLPLFNFIFRTLKFICPSFFISAIVSGMCWFLPAFMAVVTLCAIIITAILGYAVYLCTAVYQMWITSIAIYRFINHRRLPSEQRRLTRRKVLDILLCVVLTMFVKEWGTWIAWAMCTNNRWNMNVMYFYFFGTNILCQIFLFFGIALQFSMESSSRYHVDTRNHRLTNSVSVIATHVKVIGASKLALFIIVGISHVTGIQTGLAIIHFCFIDMFLVLLVIEITEIHANPNEFQQINNTNGPGEAV